MEEEKRLTIHPIADGLGEFAEVVKAVVDDLKDPLPVHLVI